MSSPSPSLSASISCSESDDDSLCGSGTLGASQWNRHRALRSLRPRSSTAEEGGKNKEQDHGFAHLVTKRRYAAPDPSSLSANNPKAKEDKKTEIEKAVLMDCLSHHFLWSHLSTLELEALCLAFEKCIYRNHEIIFSQGDAARYMYIVFSGEVAHGHHQSVDTSSVDEEREDDSPSDRYTVLGDLAVLTGSTYKETIRSASDTCCLFRLSSVSFHRALRPAPEIDMDKRVSLFTTAVPDEMVDYFTKSDLNQIASAMATHAFDAGDVLVKKKDQLNSLIIVAKGSVVAKNVTLGGRSYADQIFGPDAPSTTFGWQSLLSSIDGAHPNFQGKMVAQTDGIALTLSKDSFVKVMKNHHRDSSTIMEQMAAHRLARIELQQLPVFQDSCLDETEIENLIELMHRCEYCPPGNEYQTIFRTGEKVNPAMYFVREGTVTLEVNRGEDRRIVEAGDYFGEANMLRDQNKDGKKHFVTRSPMAAIAHGPRTIIDILYLEECRAFINTTMLGLGYGTNSVAFESSIEWADINFHTLLGTGTFGQVWLASIPKQNEGDVNASEEVGKQVVALKVQSKHQVIDSGEAGRVVAERNILASLPKSPFLLQLFDSFQDECLLYLITSVAQGGELESLIPDDGMCEASALFYAAGVLEGLAFMHRRHLIHRDIKPQNVLINEKGYPVLVDFGFAKYVPEKTFTFVGSPIFTAPEIIRFQGHDKSCDYWAWGVLLYRLVTGKYPFFQKGMDEFELYKNICRGTIELDGQMTPKFRMLMVSVLYPNPAKRLGSARNGWIDLFNSPWFANDDLFDIRRLRMQQITAPWIPGLANPLDASRFHPRDDSETEDLLHQTFPPIEEKHEQIFATFRKIE